MNKKIIILLVAGLGLGMALMAGAVFGGALVYTAFSDGGVRTALAALSEPFEKGKAAAGIADVQEVGVLISGVEPDSPADQAGLVRGDIIVAFNGEAVNHFGDLVVLLADVIPGTEASMKVLHGDDEKTLTVVLGDRSGKAYLGINSCDGPAQARVFSKEIPFGPEAFGDAMPGVGVVVMRVLPDTPAEKAGLQQNDLITAVDRQPVGTGEQNLGTMLQEYNPGDTVVLEIQRAGEDAAAAITVVLGEHPEEAGKPYLGIEYQPHGKVIWGPGEGMPEGMMPNWEDIHPQMPHGFGGEGGPFFEWPGGPGHGFGLELPEGFETAHRIGQVVEDSPAAAAGLQSGDWVIAVDGKPLEDPQTIVASVQDHQPGDVIKLTVIRSSSLDAAEQEQLEIEVTLGEHPDKAGAAYMGVQLDMFLKQSLDKAPGPGGTLWRGRPDGDA